MRYGCFYVYHRRTLEKRHSPYAGRPVGFAEFVPHNPVGAGILTVHLRGPDSPNSLLFARSRATHTEPLDLVISDTGKADDQASDTMARRATMHRAAEGREARTEGTEPRRIFSH